MKLPPSDMVHQSNRDLPEFKSWQVHREAGILRLGLNRPDDNNSLLPDVLAELADLAGFAATDPDTQVIVIHGAGRHFSQGMDMRVLAMFAEAEQDTESFAHNLRSMQASFDALEQIAKPVVAQLHGFCIGGGLILAACCDFRIASSKTVFALPEVRAGLGVIMGLKRIVDLCGVARAKELAMLGDRFSAKKALQLGLLTAISKPDDLQNDVAILAAKLKRLPISGLAINKCIINETKTLDIRHAQDLEIEMQVKYLKDTGFQQAMRRYVQGR